MPGGPPNRDPEQHEAGPASPPPADDAPHLSATSLGRALRQTYPTPLAPHPELDAKLRELGDDQE